MITVVLKSTMLKNSNNKYPELHSTITIIVYCSRLVGFLLRRVLYFLIVIVYFQLVIIVIGRVIIKTTIKFERIL